MAVPVAVGRASAAVMYCARKVGWTWMGLLSWANALLSWAPALTLTAYATVGLVWILPACNTFWRAWRMNAVAGGTRGEPFVASLLSCACPLLLSIKNIGWDFDKLVADESVWINGLSTVVFCIYLAMFLYFAEQNSRRTTLVVWIPIGAFYLALTATFGWLSESTTFIQWLCTLAVMASWCIPVHLALFEMERVVGNLPDYLSSSAGLLYCLVWSFRALESGPDNHSLWQNIVGAVCSCVFLALRALWTQGEAVQGELVLPLIVADEQIIEIEDQQGGQHLELAVEDPEPVHPVAVDPPQVHPGGVDPPQVNPVVIDPQLVHPVAVDPPQVHPVIPDQPPVFPVVIDPPPALPVAIDPPPPLPVDDPQQLPVVQPPQQLPVVQPPPQLPAVQPQQLPAVQPQQLPVVQPPQQLPAVQPQQPLPVAEPEAELPVDPPPDPEPGAN